MVTIAYRGVFLIACCLCVAACSPEGERSAPAGDTVAEQQVPQPAPEPEAVLSGLDAYNKVCAHCHETGVNGAPVTGDPAEWQGRSPLWQAVLMEHAKAGYLEMPAKGGQDELSDWTINAATQYMLEMTFPDRPRD